MFVGAGMPSILGPTRKKYVRKNPGKEGKARKAISRGTPAMITAPAIAVITPAQTALLTYVCIGILAELVGAHSAPPLISLHLDRCHPMYIHWNPRMTRRKYSFWIDDGQAAGLKVVKARDGVLESEQIRRAINDWLEKKGVKKAERPRASTRKRS
jgi:hypothetical protein